MSVAQGVGKCGEVWMLLMHTTVYPHDLCALTYGVITCLKGAVLGTGSGREAVFVVFLLEPLVYLLPSDHACFVWLFDWQ